jgi:DNA-binding transcriptional MerR regulator
MSRPKQLAETNVEGRYPIRTVANLTGVNPVTLRAWERRYQLIVPQRTAKGHRLYAEEDIGRIRKVLDLLDQGVSIGQVKGILGQQEDDTTPSSAESRDVWESYQARMLAAVEQFDEHALDAIYNDALSLYPIDLVNSRLTTPLLRSFGERWKERSIVVAEEHFFSFYLRNKLGARVHHLNLRSTGPILLLACLPGEYHEVGMLFFALAAVNRGYRVLSLGANMPLELLPEVVSKRPCRAVVLSGSGKPARGLLQETLPEIISQLDIPVFVGGAITQRHANAITATGAIAIGKDIQPALKQITETLASAA